MTPQLTPLELERLADEIRGWGRELGFANIGFAGALRAGRWSRP